RLAQAGQVRSAVPLRDVIGEALDVLAVRVVPLHRNFDGHPVLLADGVEDVRMEHRLAAVHVLDEALDAARVREALALAVALVHELDLGPVVEERELAYALRENLPVILDAAESLRRGHEMDLGAAPVRCTDHCEGRDRDAAAELYLMGVAVAPDPE